MFGRKSPENDAQRAARYLRKGAGSPATVEEDLSISVQGIRLDRETYSTMTPEGIHMMGRLGAGSTDLTHTISTKER